MSLQEPEILLLAGGRGRRLAPGAADEEPWESRIRVTPREDRSLEVSLAAAGGGAEAVVFDLARDLPDLARLEFFEDLLEPWVPSLAAAPKPLPPPRPLVLVLPFSAFPHAARRLRAWADRRLHRPLVLVAEPLALLAAHLDQVRGREEVLWLPEDHPCVGLEVREEPARAADVVGLKRRVASEALAAGARRLAPWLLGQPSPKSLQIGLRPQIQVTGSDLRSPLAAWRLPVDGTLLASVRLEPRPGVSSGEVEVRASLGSGRGDSVSLASLAIARPGWLELEIHRGSGVVRTEEGASAAFRMPELVA